MNSSFLTPISNETIRNPIAQIQQKTKKKKKKKTFYVLKTNVHGLFKVRSKKNTNQEARLPTVLNVSL